MKLKKFTFNGQDDSFNISICSEFLSHIFRETGYYKISFLYITEKEKMDKFELLMEFMKTLPYSYRLSWPEASRHLLAFGKETPLKNFKDIKFLDLDSYIFHMFFFCEPFEKPTSIYSFVYKDEYFSEYDKTKNPQLFYKYECELFEYLKINILKRKFCKTFRYFEYNVKRFGRYVNNTEICNAFNNKYMEFYDINEYFDYFDQQGPLYFTKIINIANDINKNHILNMFYIINRIEKREDYINILDLLKYSKSTLVWVIEYNFIIKFLNKPYKNKFEFLLVKFMSTEFMDEIKEFDKINKFKFFSIFRKHLVDIIIWFLYIEHISYNTHYMVPKRYLSEKVENPGIVSIRNKIQEISLNDFNIDLKNKFSEEIGNQYLVLLNFYKKSLIKYVMQSYHTIDDQQYGSY